MDLSEMQTRVAELEQQISALPAGSVTKKTVRGKDYFYHRWTENKKRREKYIPADELEDFRAQIERRKELEQELKALKKQLPKAKSANPSAFTTNVRTGEALRSFAASVRGYRRRECFRQLHDFVYGEPQDKVFILYGLRRTGKTTMIRQIFAEMNDTAACQGSVHSDHCKRHAGRREPRPQGIGSAGLSLCVPRRSDADGGFHRGRGAVF